MSLNDFAPYIQFLAAFYLSLAFEGLIKRFFFTPVFAKRLNDLYDSVSKQFGLDEAEKEVFCSKMEARKQMVLRYTQYISCMSFISCLVLLLIAGIEISVPATSFSWEKNSWLGYWWSIVIVAVTVPAIFCTLYALHYRYCKVPKIKGALDDLNEEMANNIRNFISGNPGQCSDFFKNEIIKQVTNASSVDKAEILIKAKESYSKKCFEDLIAMV